MNLKIVDEIIRVDDRECFLMTRDLVRLEGLFVGGSGGAAVAGAIKYAKQSGKKENILVLLPDGASKYISKIFNDDWMKENGFLEEEGKGFGTVRDLLAGKPHAGVVTVTPSTTLRDVIDTLKSHGISQVPVLVEGKLRGLVHEVDVLRHLLAGKVTQDSAIEPIIESDYATVTPSTKVELLKGVLGDAKLAVVMDGDTVVGVVTKIDLIDYLTRIAAPQV